MTFVTGCENKIEQSFEFDNGNLDYSDSEIEYFKYSSSDSSSNSKSKDESITILNHEFLGQKTQMILSKMRNKFA